MSSAVDAQLSCAICDQFVIDSIPCKAAHICEYHLCEFMCSGCNFTAFERRHVREHCRANHLSEDGLPTSCVLKLNVDKLYAHLLALCFGRRRLEIVLERYDPSQRSSRSRTTRKRKAEALDDQSGDMTGAIKRLTRKSARKSSANMQPLSSKVHTNDDELFVDENESSVESQENDDGSYKQSGSESSSTSQLHKSDEPNDEETKREKPEVKDSSGVIEVHVDADAEPLFDKTPASPSMFAVAGEAKKARRQPAKRRDWSQPQAPSARQGLRTRDVTSKPSTARVTLASNRRRASFESAEDASAADLLERELRGEMLNTVDETVSGVDASEAAAAAYLQQAAGSDYIEEVLDDEPSVLFRAELDVARVGGNLEEIICSLGGAEALRQTGAVVVVCSTEDSNGPENLISLVDDADYEMEGGQTVSELMHGAFDAACSSAQAHFRVSIMDGDERPEKARGEVSPPMFDEADVAAAGLIPSGNGTSSYKSAASQEKACGYNVVSDDDFPKPTLAACGSGESAQDAPLNEHGGRHDGVDELDAFFE